jgi:hypothetical protein
MKLNAVFSRSFSIFTLFTLASLSHTSANTISVGGYVPERRNLTITPTYGAELPDPARVDEVATIEIDNNLPDYELVLDFKDRDGGSDAISEVRLEELAGTLGSGLSAPTGSVLTPEADGESFVWHPGTQQTATNNYRMRVLVTYKRPLADRPVMRVTMPISL